MYLLIPPHAVTTSGFLFKFTSHYVSINSNAAIIIAHCYCHLHPTMYLLILNNILCTRILHHHLHPTMYLLIQQRYYSFSYSVNDLHPTMYLLILGFCRCFCTFCCTFTSHYVSINSTLFALIPPLISIYIPLCIY